MLPYVFPHFLRGEWFPENLTQYHPRLRLIIIPTIYLDIPSRFPQRSRGSFTDSCTTLPGTSPGVLSKITLGLPSKIQRYLSGFLLGIPPIISEKTTGGSPDEFLDKMPFINFLYKFMEGSLQDVYFESPQRKPQRKFWRTT